jgi:hypothetical protein
MEFAMLKLKNLVLPLVTFLLGGGLSLGLITWRKAAPIVPNPTSSVLCFLKGDISDPPLFQVNGLAVNRKDIPPELREAFLQMELDHHTRLEVFAQQLALRLDAAGVKKLPAGTPLPSLESLLGGVSTDEDVLAYYNTHKASFGSNSFETVSPLIRTLLDRQNQNLTVSVKIKKILDENRYQSLHAVPCGEKLELPLDNDTPALGNTAASVNFAYLLDYSCSVCSHLKGSLDTFLNQNLSRMRLWYLIYPGAEGSRTEWLARGAHCTFKLDASKFVSYHNYASSLPLLSDVDRNDQATTYESIALTLAEKVQLDIQDFKTCLHADETLARLKMVRDLVTEQGISTRPAFFINQRQVMVADPTDITSTFSLILSERDRLSPYLP